MSHSTEDPNPKLAGHEHKSFRSIAVSGADGQIAFEKTDAPARVVIVGLAIVAGLAIFCFALMFGYDKMLISEHPAGELPSPLSASRVLPPAPQLETHPWEDLPEMHAHEKQVLAMSGKDSHGLYHIPIDNAIDEVVSKINTKPDEPQGLTVPGGQGRIFSHSLSEMPAPYQQPTIQGVIQGAPPKK
jgi:hypothetical protein